MRSKLQASGDVLLRKQDGKQPERHRKSLEKEEARSYLSLISNAAGSIPKSPSADKKRGENREESSCQDPKKKMGESF